MTEKNEWVRFCAQASVVMRDALENRITLNNASALFEQHSPISDPDLRRQVESGANSVQEANL
jgi:hypothetical protein